MHRILFLQTKLIPDGPGVVVRNIVSHLDRSAFEPLIGCMYGTGELEGWYRSQGIKTVNFRMRGPVNGWLDFLALNRMVRFFKEERVDLVHTHLVRADIYGRIASQISGIPVITTVHNTEEHHTSTNACDSIVRYLDKVTIRSCERVVAVSEAVKRLLCGVYGLAESKVIVVHNGIAAGARVGSGHAKEVIRSEGEIVLCTVARLHRQKGLHELVRATELLSKQGLRVKAIVIGDGPLRNELLALVRELKANVILLGFQEDVSRFIEAADIFVLPSLWEGFGLALIEAMRSSKPVVATRVGGIPEVVQDGLTGILCPPGDPTQLAAAIGTLAKDPGLRTQMGEAGRKTVENYFTAERMCERYQEVYSRVLLKPRSGASA